jgi:hypothetical protein
MRKLLMLAVTVLAAFAFAGVSATTASAMFKLYTPDYQGFCPEVSLAGGEVTGGCLVEDFQGSFDLYMSTQPLQYFVGHYVSTFDLVLDENGDGYAVNSTVSSTSSAPPRQACAGVPWAVNSHASTWFELEMDITLNVGPSGTNSCTQQTITVQAAWPSWEFQPTELDQATPSTNVADGYWYSDNPLRIDWDSTYED